MGAAQQQYLKDAAAAAVDLWESTERDCQLQRLAGVGVITNDQRTSSAQRTTGHVLRE